MKNNSTALVIIDMQKEGNFGLIQMEEAVQNTKELIDVMEDPNYNLEGFELMPTSEAAMFSVMETKIQQEEPFIITGWRPHSMFSRHDLKFLEDPEGHFMHDNVYVLSYQGLEEKHPEAYDILSRWSIEVADLEEMMYEYEHNNVPFTETAKNWVETNRDQVDRMLGNE